MSEEYARGFKDGFAAGLEEGKKLTPVVSKDPTRLDDYVFGQPGYLGMPNTCHVCGRLQSGVEGYVCYSPRCPTKVTCTSVVKGAVGSEVSQTYGAVGAKSPAGPYDGPEYTNKVWINGFWTELGS